MTKCLSAGFQLFSSRELTVKFSRILRLSCEFSWFTWIDIEAFTFLSTASIKISIVGVWIPMATQQHFTFLLFDVFDLLNKSFTIKIHWWIPRFFFTNFILSRLSVMHTFIVIIDVICHMFLFLCLFLLFVFTDIFFCHHQRFFMKFIMIIYLQKVVKSRWKIPNKKLLSS